MGGGSVLRRTGLARHHPRRTGDAAPPNRVPASIPAGDRPVSYPEPRRVVGGLTFPGLRHG
jgi:hypothetical protein